MPSQYASNVVKNVFIVICKFIHIAFIRRKMSGGGKKCSVGDVLGEMQHALYKKYYYIL